MRRILVTGCSGFLGSHLLERLTAEGEKEILGLTEVADFRSRLCRVLHLDIRDHEGVKALIADFKPDIVYHLAAIANVGFSWRNPRLTYEVNFLGSANLIEALSEAAPQTRLLLMSSAELYAAPGNGPITEQSAMAAKNPYALSKLAMEKAADMYRESHGLDILKVRSFNFTGPGQDSQFVCSDFARQVAEIEKGRRRAEIRVGNLSAIRDMSDVRDICRYLTRIAAGGAAGEIYNLCSGRAVAISDVLDMLLAQAEAEIKVVVDQEKFRPLDVPVLAGDCSRIRKKFDCRPTFSLSQTLSDVLAYWRERL